MPGVLLWRQSNYGRIDGSKIGIVNRRIDGIDIMWSQRWRRQYLKSSCHRWLEGEQALPAGNPPPAAEAPIISNQEGNRRLRRSVTARIT